MWAWPELRRERDGGDVSTAGQSVRGFDGAGKIAVEVLGVVAASKRRGASASIVSG